MKREEYEALGAAAREVVDHVNIQGRARVYGPGLLEKIDKLHFLCEKHGFSAKINVFLTENDEKPK